MPFGDTSALLSEGRFASRDKGFGGIPALLSRGRFVQVAAPIVIGLLTCPPIVVAQVIAPNAQSSTAIAVALANVVTTESTVYGQNPSAGALSVGPSVSSQNAYPAVSASIVSATVVSVLATPMISATVASPDSDPDISQAVANSKEITPEAAGGCP